MENKTDINQYMERDEEIIKASTTTFKENGDEFSKVVQLFWMSAFISGAKWSDEHPKNVWYDANEEPENGAHILMECKLLDSKEYKSYNIDYKGVVNWEVLKRYFGISRWAYISDLLPKGGKE